MSVSGMLYNLHLLRVGAALAVVYFHTVSVGGFGLDWDVGSRGVDVFFVISGFIIAYIGTAKPERFFVRRLIRIVPFYWLATLGVFIAATAAPTWFRTTEADPVHLVFSLLFIPHEGEWPTLLLGWSLNYEMAFYVVFAIMLAIFRIHAPWMTCLVIIGGVTVIEQLEEPDPTLEFYGHPIVLEFCYGVLAFYGFRACERRRAVFERHRLLRWVLIASLIVAIVLLVVLEHAYRGALPRQWVAGIPAFVIVLSAILLERMYGVTSRSRLGFLLGEASYIIYLIHPYIIYGVLRLGGLDATLASEVIAVIVAALLVVTSAISVAIHVWLERPMLAYLRRRIGGPVPDGPRGLGGGGRQD